MCVCVFFYRRARCTLPRGCVRVRACRYARVSNSCVVCIVQGRKQKEEHQQQQLEQKKEGDEEEGGKEDDEEEELR